MTANEIIIAAYQELGITVSGGSPNANDLTWGLAKLNRFLNSLSSDGINLHYRTEESFNLVAGTASYTIGSGGDFDTARPNIIEQAWIRDSDHDYPVSVRPISEYWSLPEKTTQNRPVKLYYDTKYSSGVIYLYYTPSDTDPLHIVSQKPLTVYTSGLTEVSLPVEYQDALVLNLAIRFASRYGKTVSADLRLGAKEAFGNVRAMNLSGQMKGANLGLPGQRETTYNIESDY